MKKGAGENSTSLSSALFSEVKPRNEKWKPFASSCSSNGWCLFAATKPVCCVLGAGSWVLQIENVGTWEFLAYPIFYAFFIFQACLHSCFQHIMVRKCGCGYYYYPLPPGAEYCDYNKQPAWGKTRRLRSGSCWKGTPSYSRHWLRDSLEYCPSALGLFPA